MSILSNFSTGRDVSLNVITPTGPLSLNLITSFTAKPLIIDRKIKGLDGITRHVRFPDGWEGSFEIERQDSTLDDLWATIESNYYAGLGEKPSTITQTNSEPNGGISQYRFIGVLVKYDDAGKWAGDDTVKQKLSFVAQRRLKVA